MKALFRNDLYLYGRYYGIVTAVFFIITGLMTIGMESEGSNYSVVGGLFGIIIMSMIPLGICSYNERSGWNQYCMTLSITKKQYVSEKYLLTLIIVLVYVLFEALLVWSGVSAAEPDNIYIKFKVTAIVVAAGLFGPMIVLPVTFRFNARAGLTVFFILVFLLDSMIMGILSGYHDEMTKADDAFYKLFPAAVMLVAVILYALSWLLSVHLYEKKEL